MTFTISWIEEFIRCIDETYEEYTETRLNADKAWSITTRLAKALLVDISIPRIGVKAALKTRNKLQMKQITFYGTMSSLDRMKAFSKAGFKNSSVVSNELVKVLAKRTNIAAIEKLELSYKDLCRENDKLRSELSDVKAKNTEANNISNVANNRFGLTKSELVALVKRVKRLEDKT